MTFTDVAVESGLAGRILHAGRKDPQDWVLETIGGGASAFDYDGDGDMDLLLVDGDRLDGRCEPVGEADARTRLWRNDGGMRFTDVSEAARIDVRGYGLGCAAADYDGDGYADIAIAGYRFLRLLRSRGDGTFDDVTSAAGLPVSTLDTSTSCAWGDLDGDGLADLFVTNYADQYAEAREIERAGLPPRSCVSRDRVVYCGPMGLPVGRNRVYFQRPDHSFEDRTATHLVSAEGSYSFQAVMSDLDNDGDLDVYVTNDGRPNFLYVNDGHGRLTDRAVECGAAADEMCKAQASMGVDVADYDRDGRLDLFVTNFSDDRNTLYRNVAGRCARLTFEDVTARTGISVRPQGRLCWGTKLVDFDNDTTLDTFISCGHVYPESEHLPGEHTTNLQRPLLIRGLGPPAFRFEDVTDRGGAAFRSERLWRGAAFADFDDDGDWDVLATAMRDPPALFRNDGGSRRAWVRLDLRGRAPLTCAAGARATFHLTDGTRIVEELHVGSSYGGSNDPRLLVGIGDVDVVPRIEVRWPDGTRSVLENVPARTAVVVRQPAR
ncbi:MAG: CRTAC1 family protein [Planctomycetes bacterium]|nr:CRTAC1 family protein [Planctomycetota bacterium]